jgi:hypothetical protein
MAALALCDKRAVKRPLCCVWMRAGKKMSMSKDVQGKEKKTYLTDDVLEVLLCGLFGLWGRRDCLE